MQNIYEFVAKQFGNKKFANIVEIGAHIGTDTVQLAAFKGSGKMYTFEPDPRNLPILKNRVKDLDINVVEMAVGSSVGTAEFNLSSGIPPYEDAHISETKQHTASSSLKKPMAHLERFTWVKFDEKITVPITTLDDYFADKGFMIDLCWVDIQGAEAEMIKGGQQTLSRTKFLFTEFNNEQMYAGQIGLKEIIARLPGSWGIVQIFGDEVLLQNKTYGSEWICDIYAQRYWDERYSVYNEWNRSIDMTRDFFSIISQYEQFNDVFAKANSLLEIGCGLGEASNLAKTRYPISKVAGTDVSTKAIELAKKAFNISGLSFYMHDARKVHPEQFDLTMCVNVLQHFKNPYLLVDNMLAVSKHCVITVPNDQPVTDGYEDEGGPGHVFMFNKKTFDKYNVKSWVIYKTAGWQHSSKGEDPLEIAYLIGAK